MADCSIHTTTELSHRLSSLSTFLPAIEQLQRLLTSYLSAQTKNLLSLIETAKSTLRRSGIRLHKFANCPAYLRQHKAAYFALLDDLQAHSRQYSFDPSDRELQAQLSRLLFPLTTQMNIATTSARASRQAQAWHSTTTAAAQVPSPRALRLPPSSLCLPPNAMPPPPEPSSGEHKSFIPSKYGQPSGRIIDVSQTRKISGRLKIGLARTAASVRRHSRQRSVTQFDDSPSSSQSDDSDNSDEEAEDGENVTPVVLPRPSPLRRSFGIFCTGRNKSIKAGSSQRQRV